MELKINQKYKLIPLKEVEKDDLSSIFNEGKGIYLCNYPNENWYNFHKFKRETNYSIEKKTRYYKLMNRGSRILSLTMDSKINSQTQDLQDDHVSHIGSAGFKGRMAQILMTLRAIVWITKQRKTFDYILVYNFYFFQFFIGLYAKYILNKKFYIDFEDDYLLKSTSFLSKFIFKFQAYTIDKVICINRSMVGYFDKKKAFVFNGFIDLNYVGKCDFSIKENSTFFYSGALDDIRGADQLEDLKTTLKERLKQFKIFVSGSGPLSPHIEKLQDDNLEYLGFLSDEDYNKVLNASDFLLVLQKPDHPFNKGSFPSKIEKYCEFEKPILKLEVIAS